MFLLEGGLVVFDFDLDSLDEALIVIDRQVAAAEEQIRESSDPDGDGLGDRMEGIVGLGFVACQQYLNATWKQLAGRDEKKRKQRREIVALGPNHACGLSFAKIIDAFANYWKHHGEWPHHDKSKADFEKKTREVMEKLVSPSETYPLGNGLVHLAAPRPAKFGWLVLKLAEWRNAQVLRPA